MDLRQKRDIRRLGRQIIQIIFFLWMPALYTSAFSGVRYVIEQIRAGKPIEQNAFLVMLIVLCGFTILFGRLNVCIFKMGSEKSEKEASVGIRRDWTKTSKN